MELKKADILMFKGNGNWRNFWMSWENLFTFLVKLGTLSQYAHVGIVLEVDKKKEKLIYAEAIDKGFVISNGHWFIRELIDNNKVHVYRYDKLTTFQRNEIVRAAKSIEGAKYDWRDILDLIIYIISGKNIKLGKSSNYICSEAVAFAYNVGGVELVPDKFDDEVTPLDISNSKKLKRIREPIE